MQRITGIARVLLAVPLLLAAQQPAPSPQSPALPGGEKCAIQGDVRNALTGEPVKKANLLLRRADVAGSMGAGGRFSAGFPSSYSTSTDAGGKFAMKDIDPGRYRLSVNRAGFVNVEYGARGPMRPGTTLSLEAGQQLREVVFRLTPHGVITGRVLDEDGEPVTRAQVQTLQYRYNQGRKQLMPMAGESTNDLGEFRIFGVAPGRYFLRAAYHDRMMFEPSIDRSAAAAPDKEHVPTYYPGTTDISGAAMIEVTPGGQLRGMDLALSKARTVRVRGRVQVASGLGRRNITVMAVPRDSNPFFGAVPSPVIDRDGNFELRGVSPGSYTLMAQLFDDGKMLVSRQPLDVGSANVENVMISISSGMDLAGQVRIDGPTTASVSDMRITLRSGEPGPMMMMTPNARIKDDGTFLLTGVNPDRYQAQLSGLPDGCYVKSIRMGDQNDALNTGLNLTSGAGGHVEIVLGQNAGVIDGLVQNEKQQPVAGASVVLIPQSGRRDHLQLYKNTSTDQYGRFTLKNLEPGEYKLFAWEDVEYGAYMDPDFVKPVDSKGKAITIREGSRESAELKLIPAEGGPPASDTGRTSNP